MDFRRNSTLSLKDTHALSKYLLPGNNWFETYLAFQKQLIPIDEESFALDILRDLCDETINDTVKLHLLSLLEQYFWIFSEQDRLEQTIGSLINIFLSSKSSDDVRAKYLYTCTILWNCHINQVKDSLQKLLKSFLKTLVNFLNDNKQKCLSHAACQCLIQLEETNPGIIFEYIGDAKIPNNHPNLLCLLLKNGSSFEPTTVKQLIDSLPSYNTDPYNLHQILNYLFDLMESKRQYTLTPLIFKQFLPFFTYSTESYHLHFSLLLLRSFGLELFSTNEELNLLNRLIVLCTHPSLTIAHRLLFLDFAKSLLPILRSSNLADPSIFSLTSFDGPDTQEKKLMILCETPISDVDLIMSLKTIEMSSINQGNRRATNALYRQLYYFLTVRPSLQQQIENLLISMIMASPVIHIPYSLCLLDQMPSLTARVSTTLISKLLNMASVMEDNKTHFREYFLAIRWIFKQPRSLLSSDKKVAILRFCLDRAEKYPAQLSKELLSIVAVVIRYQTIDESLKELLNDILNFLMVNKSEVTISSWSQIYSIALNTLPSQEALRKVFREDIDDDDDKSPLIIDSSLRIPLSIHEIKCTPDPVQIDCNSIAIPYIVKILFNGKSLEAADPNSLEKLYAIEIRLTCLSQNIDEVINIPFLRNSDFKIFHLKLSPVKVKPFTLNMDLRFSDSNGVTYCCPNFSKELFNFDRFMLPVKCFEETFNQHWNSMSKRDDCFLTVLCLQHYSSLESFLTDHEIFKDYSISNGKFTIGIAPNRLVLIRSIVVNGTLNLRIWTNIDKALKYLYYLFKRDN